ncbi:MAG: glycosyltransferase [Chloroflexi bacterium]|nr:glycosyltransferase [Chloroflexota bacterium]
MQPRISIVTPSYNQGHFLEAALDSVLDQGYANLEYIVIDGGSTDDSPAIIARRADRLAYWVSEPDRGQSHAINKGFKQATGAIYGWLNSDDLYEEGALAEAARLLGGKQRALLVGAAVLTDGPETLSGHTDSRQPTWEEILYDARSFPQPSVFWTSDLWELAGPLDEDLYFAMDYDLWVRMMPHVQETIFTERVLSYERSHPDQKSAEKSTDLFHQQRAYAAVRAARQTHRSVWGWLVRIWLRRAALAVRRRRPSLLKGSGFHQHALHMALRPRRSGL